MQEILIKIIRSTLEKFEQAQIMVFFNEKVQCKEITEKIQQNEQLKFIANNNKICEMRNSTDSEAYVSRQEQQRIIEEFRSGQKILMLCSDLMGRGMNFRKVRLVVNYGVPRVFSKGRIDSRRYDQRVGRTGRMEDLGVALTILNPAIINGEQYPETDIKNDFIERNIKFEDYNPNTFEKKIEEVLEKTK